MDDEREPELPTIIDRVELRDSPRVRAPRMKPLGVDLEPGDWCRYLAVRDRVWANAKRGVIDRADF